MRTASDLPERLVDWRRHLHANPELSYEEHETAKFIEDELDRSGLTPRRVAGTGVVVEIEGSEEGGTVGVRADIDALPITEATNLAFASKRTGVMHACGHDGHTAIALGLARTLAGDRAFPGRVRIFFQPAEEVPPGGAQALIDEGVLDGCGSIVGLHILANVPAHAAAIRKGPMMAATDNFEITIHGGGGHASRPHDTTDPIAAMGQVIVAVQNVVSRRIDPLQPAVLTIGRAESGTTHNVIPREARLYGTLRSLDEGVRALLGTELARAAKAACQALGTTCDVEVFGGYPALVNDAAMVDVLVAAAEKHLGAGNVAETPPIMGGEDFARYADVAPSGFLFLGGGRPAPHHHPEFDFDEDVMIHGVRILGSAAFALAGRDGK
jgi:amidohydrolase